MWLECGYMKKCGKNWGYPNEIEKIQVVPHFQNKYSSYMQNHLKLREYTSSHIQQNPNENVTKVEVTWGSLYTFRLYYIIYCKIKEFSDYISEDQNNNGWWLESNNCTRSVFHRGKILSSPIFKLIWIKVHSRLEETVLFQVKHCLSFCSTCWS